MVLKDQNFTDKLYGPCVLAIRLMDYEPEPLSNGRGALCMRNRECKPIPRIVTRVQKEKCCTFGDYSAAC